MAVRGVLAIFDGGSAVRCANHEHPRCAESGLSVRCPSQAKQCRKRAFVLAAMVTIEQTKLPYAALPQSGSLKIYFNQSALE